MVIWIFYYIKIVLHFTYKYFICWHFLIIHCRDFNANLPVQRHGIFSEYGIFSEHGIFSEYEILSEYVIWWEYEIWTICATYLQLSLLSSYLTFLLRTGTNSILLPLLTFFDINMVVSNWHCTDNLQSWPCEEESDQLKCHNISNASKICPKR